MDLLKETDTKILHVINPIMDNLMDGSTEINYSKHVQDFSSRIKEQISLARFEEICEEYQRNKGFFTKREFVALFKRKDSIAVVWRQMFSKTQDEFIAEAVFKEENKRLVVDHVFVL